MPTDIRQPMGELKAALARLYGRRLLALYLYGSYARGDFHADSDVDVLVVLSGPVDRGEEINRMSSAVAEICLRHDILISTIPVEPETFDSSEQAFYDRVRQEAVLI